MPPRLQLWSGVSEDAKDLVRSLLQQDPQQRLTAEQVGGPAAAYAAVGGAAPLGQLPWGSLAPRSPPCLEASGVLAAAVGSKACLPEALCMRVRACVYVRRCCSTPG